MRERHGATEDFLRVSGLFPQQDRALQQHYLRALSKERVGGKKVQIVLLSTIEGGETEGHIS